MHFDSNWANIRDWQDVGAAISILTSLGLIVSVWIGFRQLRVSLLSTRVDKSIDIFTTLTARFAAITAERNQLDQRVAAGDRTVQKGQYAEYFIKYWSLQVEQYQYFVSELIPFRIYLVWMMYLNRKLRGEDRYAYFVADGTTGQITSSEAYDTYCRKTSLANYTSTISFFEELSLIEPPPLGTEAQDPIYVAWRNKIRRLLMRRKRLDKVKFWL